MLVVVRLNYLTLKAMGSQIVWFKLTQANQSHSYDQRLPKTQARGHSSPSPILASAEAEGFEPSPMGTLIIFAILRRSAYTKFVLVYLLNLCLASQGACSALTLKA